MTRSALNRADFLLEQLAAALKAAGVTFTMTYETDLEDGEVAIGKFYGFQISAASQVPYILAHVEHEDTPDCALVEDGRYATPSAAVRGLQTHLQRVRN